MRTAQPHIITFIISLLVTFECVKPDDTITVPTIDGKFNPIFKSNSILNILNFLSKIDLMLKICIKSIEFQ